MYVSVISILLVNVVIFVIFLSSFFLHAAKLWKLIPTECSL